MKDYHNQIPPNWCPGCGHFSVLRALQVAAAQLNIPNERLAVISGIGCSGRISGYTNTYGLHGIHGRALPIAQGIKLANRDLVVVAAGGDGDGFAIGLSHTLHAIRRNINMTYIVLNNQVYGLTKGHTSPLSERGFQTKSTPSGSIDTPIKPGILALANGATYYAQAFSAQQEQLIHVIVKGIEHEGFSMINVFSPCVTYNRINTYQWFREHLKDLDADKAYHSNDYQRAMNTLIELEGLCTGIVYQSMDTVPPHNHHSLINSNLSLSKNEFQSLVNQYR